MVALVDTFVVMSKHTSPTVRTPSRVIVYSTTYCPYCVRATHLLRRRGIAFEEIDVTRDHETRAWLVKTTGRRTVPQIFIDGAPIGGSDELAALDRSGELARLLGVAA
jgi:glutaredoxin 3